MFGLFKKNTLPQEPVEDTQPVEPVDRRDHARRNVYTDIQVTTPLGTDLRRGLVLDMSAQGARLRLQHGERFVDGMLVKIPRYGLTVPARVCWSTTQDIGVQFKSVES